MLKHLTGVKQFRGRVGQTPEEDAQQAASDIADGAGTAGIENSFDWVEFVDALGNTFSVGLDAYGNFLIAQATANNAALMPPSALPPLSGTLEPAGVITESDTQMFLTLGLLGLGLIFLSRKL
jgi:hypothetical protein